MGHAAHEPTDIFRYRPDLDPKLAKAIMSCVEREPAKRCPSMEHFLGAIRSVKSEGAD
jgi:hypothetical protein